jgi:hypothetical protein
MDMTILSRVLAWLLKLSLRNNIPPSAGAMPCVRNAQHAQQNGATPLEISSKEEATWGLNCVMGQQDYAARGPRNEFIRSHSKGNVLCNCGHIAYQMQAIDKPGEQAVRGIAGQCQYCVAEFEKAVQKNEMTPEEAERRSLVCSECAKIIKDGILSCPRHCVAMTDVDGQTIYLDSAQTAELDRKQAVQNILSPLLGMFGDQDPSQNVNEETQDV